MITLRSRMISIILTFMMVFTTLFGNASFAMAATTETGADAPTTVEQDVDQHNHDTEATEEGGEEDSTSADPTQQTDQATDPTQAADQIDATEPPAAEEPETYNVDLFYTETEDENGNTVYEAPANGDITFEYKDADGKKVEVTAAELEEAANDADIDDGIELEEGTEVTVTFTPDKGYYTFYYMAYLAKDEDQEVPMVIDDEDDLDFEVERKATFEVGTDDIVVDILFEKVEEEGTESGSESNGDQATREEASTWATGDGSGTQADPYLIELKDTKSMSQIELYWALYNLPAANYAHYAFDGSNDKYNTGSSGSYTCEPESTHVLDGGSGLFSVRWTRGIGYVKFRVYHDLSLNITNSTDAVIDVNGTRYSGAVSLYRPANDSNPTAEITVSGVPSGYGVFYNGNLKTVENGTCIFNSDALSASRTDTIEIIDLRSVVKVTTSGDGTGEVSVSKGSESIAANGSANWLAGTVGISATPDADCYVEDVTVTSENITGAGYTNYAYNGSFSITDNTAATSSSGLTQKTYTVNVKFGNRAFTPTPNKEITYDPATMDDEALKNLVLDEVIGTEATLGTGLNQYSISYEGSLEYGAKTFVVVWHGDGNQIPDVTRTVEVTLKQGKLEAIAAPAAVVKNVNSTAEFNAVADDVKDAIIKANPGLVENGVEYVTVTLAEGQSAPTQGQNDVTYTYNVEVTENSTYKAFTTTATATVSGVRKPVNVTVTPAISDGATVPGTVTVTNADSVAITNVENNNSAAWLLTPNDNGESVLTINATPASGYYVNTITVNGTAINTDQNTVNFDGTYNIDLGAGASLDDAAKTYNINVSFVEKQLVMKDPVGTVGYNPTMHITEQTETIKQNIFAAVVDAGASIPEGLEWNDLTYSFHPWRRDAIGETWSYKSEVIDIAADADGSDVSRVADYYDFAASWIANSKFTARTEGVYNPTYNSSNREKVVLAWPASGKYPADSLEVEITLVDSRPTVTISKADLDAFTFNQKSEVAVTGTIGQAVTKAITAKIDGTTTSVPVTVTIDTESYNALLTDADNDGTTQYVEYTATVAGTETYQGATETFEVAVVGEVHESTVEVTEIKPDGAPDDLGTVVVKQGDTVIGNGDECNAGNVTFTATPTAEDYYVDSVKVTKYVNGVEQETSEEIKDATYAADTHAYRGTFVATNGDYGTAVKYVVTVNYAKAVLSLNAYAEGKEYYEAIFNGNAKYTGEAKAVFDSAVMNTAINISGSTPTMNADLSEVTVSLPEGQTEINTGEVNTVVLTWKPAGDKYPAVTEEILVFVAESRAAVDIVVDEGVTETAEVEVNGAQNSSDEEKIKAAVMDVISVMINGEDRLNDLPSGVELAYDINYDELAQGAATDITVTISYAGNGSYTGDSETVTVPLKGKVHPATVKLVTTGNGNVTVGDLTFTENEDGELVATTLAGELQITAAPTNTNGGYVASVKVDGNEIEGATNTNGGYTANFTFDDGEGSAARAGAPTYVITVDFAERTFALAEDAAIDYNFWPDYYDSSFIDEIFNTSEQDALKEAIFNALYKGDAFTFEEATVNYKDADGNWTEIDNDFAPVDNGQPVGIQIVWEGTGGYTDTAVEGSILLNEIRKPVEITGVAGTINFDEVSEVVTAIQNGVSVTQEDGTAVAAGAYTVTITDAVIDGISTAKDKVDTLQPVAYTVEVEETENYLGTTAPVELSANAQVNAYDATLDLVTVNNNDAEGTFVIENVEFNNNTASHAAGTLKFTATPTGFNNNSGNYVESVVVTAGEEPVGVDAEYIGNGVYEGTFDIVNGTEADPSEYTVTVTFDKRIINKKAFEEGKDEYVAFFNDNNEYTGEYATAFQQTVYEAVVAGSTPAGITFDKVTVGFASDTQTKPVVGEANEMNITWAASTDGKYPAVTITEDVKVTDSRSKAVITYTDPEDAVEVDGAVTFEDKVKAAINIGVSEGAAAPDIKITGTAPKQGETATVTVKVTVAENDYYLAADDVEFEFDVVGKVHPATIKLETTGNGTVTVGDLKFTDGVATANTGDLAIEAKGKSNGGYVKSVVVETAELTNVTNVNGVYNGTLSVVDGTGTPAEDGAPTYIVKVEFVERTLVLKDAEMDYNFHENYYDDKQETLKENIFSALYDWENSDAITYYEGLAINYKDAEGNWVEVDENFAPVSDTNDVDGKAVVDIQIVWEAGAAHATEVVAEATLTLKESRNAIAVSTEAVGTIAFDETAEIVPAIKDKVVVTDADAPVAADKFTVSVAEDVLEGLDLTKAMADKEQPVAYTVSVPSTADYIGTLVDVEDTATVKTKAYDATLNLVVEKDQYADGEFVIDGVEFVDNTAAHAPGTVTFTATPTGFSTGTGNYVDYVTVKTGETEITVDAEYIEDGVYTGTFEAAAGTKGDASEYTVTVKFAKRNVLQTNATTTIPWNFAKKYADLSEDEKDTLLRQIFNLYVDKSNGIKYGEVTMSPMDAEFNDVDYIYGTEQFFRVSWIGDGEKYPTVNGYVDAYFEESRNPSTINANAITTPVEVDGSYDGVIEAVIEAGVVAQSGGELSYKILEGQSTGIPKQGESGTAVVKVTVGDTDKYLGNSITVEVPIVGKVYPAIVNITNSAGGTAKVTYTKAGETAATEITSGAKVDSGILAIEGTPTAKSAYYVANITVNGENQTVTPTKDGNLTCAAAKVITDGKDADAAAKNPVYNVHVEFAERTIAFKEDLTIRVNGYVYDGLEGLGGEPKVTAFKNQLIVSNFVDFDKCVGGTASNSTMSLKMFGRTGLTSTGYMNVSALNSGHCDVPSTKQIQLTWAAEGDRYPAVTVSDINISVKEARKTPTLTNIPASVEFDASTDEILTAVQNAVKATADGKELSGLTITWKDDTRPATNKDGETQTATFVANVPASQDSLALENEEFTVNVVGNVHKSTVTYDQPENGTVTVKKGNTNVASGSECEKGDVTITATPDKDYHVESVKIVKTVTNADGTVTSEEIKDVTNEAKYGTSFDFSDTFNVEYADYQVTKDYEVVVTFAKREIQVNENIGKVRYEVDKDTGDDYMNDVKVSAYNKIVANHTDGTEYDVVFNGDLIPDQTTSTTVTWIKTPRYPAVSVTVDVLITGEIVPVDIVGVNGTLTPDNVITEDDIIAAAKISVPDDASAPEITVAEEVVTPVQGVAQEYTVNVSVATNEYYLANTASFTVTVTGAVKDPVINVTITGTGTTTATFVPTGEITGEAVVNGATVKPGTLTINAVPGEFFFVDSIKVNGNEPTANTQDAGAISFTATQQIADGTGQAVTAAAPEYNVVVTYTEKVLAKNSPIGTVGWNPTQSVTAQRDKLEQNIFNAVVNAGTSVPAGLTYDQITYEFYPVGSVTGNYRDESCDLAESNTLYKEFGARGVGVNEKVKLTWPAGGKYPVRSIEAEIMLVDSRPLSGLTNGAITVVEEYYSVEELTAALEAQIEADKMINPNGLNLTISFDETTLPDKAGVSGDIAVTVKYAGSADYQPESCTVTATVTPAASKCYVYGDGNADGTITIGSATLSPSVGTTVNGNSIVTMTVTPADGKIPTSIKVVGKAIGEDGKEGEAAPVAINTAYNNRVATVTFTSGGLDGTVNYYVTTQYEAVKLAAKNGFINYNYGQTDASGNPLVSGTELESRVYNAVYDRANTTPAELAGLVVPNSDNVKVEYVYIDADKLVEALKKVPGSGLVDVEGLVKKYVGTALWAEVGGGAPSTGNDFIDGFIEDYTHNFGETGLEQIRITYTDSKYGTVQSDIVELTVYDATYNVDVTIDTKLDGENGKPEYSSVSIEPEGRKNAEGVVQYKEYTSYTVTVDPGNYDLGNILSKDPAVKYYVEDIIVTDGDGNVVNAGDIVFTSSTSVGSTTLEDAKASVSFTTDREEDYTITVKYGTLDIVKETATQTLDLYKAGNTYPAEYPTAEELYAAVINEDESSPLVAYDPATVKVEYSTDGTNYVAYDAKAIAAMADGTELTVKVTYTPLDNEATSWDETLQYSTVYTTGKVLLKDQRTATEIEAAMPTSPVEYLEQEVLIRNLMTAMGPKVLKATNGELVTVNEQNFTVTVGSFEEIDGQAYIDVTFVYDGSTDNKPVSKTFESVPITDIPDSASVVVKSELEGTAADHGTVTMDKYADTDGTILIDKILGNTAYKLNVDPDDNYAVHSITIKKTPRETEGDGTDAAAEGEEDGESDSPASYEVTLFADAGQMPEGLAELDGTYLEFNAQTGKIVYTDKNDVKTEGLYLCEKCDYEITINYVKPEFKLKDKLVFNFKTGWDDAITPADQIKILDAVVNGEGTRPQLYLDTTKDSAEWYHIREQIGAGTGELKMEYQAAPARTVYVKVDEEIDLGMGIKFPIKTEIPVELEEIWLPVGTDIPETSNDIREVIDDFNWEDIISDVVGQFDTSDLLGMIRDTSKIEAAVTQALQTVLAGNDKLYYFGAHEFGEQGHGSSELIRFSYADEQYIIPELTIGEGDSQIKVEINDDRAETKMDINETVTVQYGLFDKAKIIELLQVEGSDSLVQFTDENGNAVPVTGLTADDFVIKDFPADIKELDVDTYEFTIRYTGSETNRPVEGTFTLDVQKAPAEVTVVNNTYRYGEVPEIIVNSAPEGVEMIKFAAGINVANTYNGGVDGVTSLDIFLEVDGALGNLLAGEYSLSELEGLIDLLVNSGILDNIGVGEESLDQVMNIITQITEATEAVDVNIKINQGNPSDIGIYAIGGVTIDSNYETAYNVGYLIIKPDGYKAELDWKIHDDNFIVTLPYIQNGEYDLGANVTKVYEGSIEDAQKNVGYFFLGIDINGEVVIKNGKDSQAIDTYGAYTQIAYMQNWGNTMYYADPIIRAMVVVPDTVKMEIPDSGSEFIYDGKQHGLDESLVECYDKNGNRREDWEANTEFIEYTYLGYDGNDIAIYNSTKPPTNVGVYTVIATYIDNANPEDVNSGRYGMGIGYMTIKPAKASLDIEDRSMTLNDYNALADSEKDGVTVDPEDCKYISVIAGIGTDGQLLDKGLDSVSGAANIDFPTRIDKVLKKIVPSAYEDGISVDALIAQLDEVNANLVELGFGEDVADIITNFLGQLPTGNVLSGVKVTFHEQEDIELGMGIYVTGAVTCDPNYTASSDFGYLILTPETYPAELDWLIHDDNMIITKTLIMNDVYPMGAYVKQGELTDEQHKTATDLLNDIIIGVDAKGNLVTTSSTAPDFKEKIDLGAYSQIAYILDDGTEIYYAAPIARAFVVTPELADVQFASGSRDAQFTFDRTRHAMDVDVYLMDEQANKVLATEEQLADHLTVKYIGYDANDIVIYNSEEPPKNVGAYTVIATYIDEENDVYGANVGGMIIKPAESSLTIESADVIYGSEEHKTYTLHDAVTCEPEDCKYITMIAGVGSDGEFLETPLNAVTGMANIDFPERIDNALKEIVPEAYTEEGISVNKILRAVDEVKARMAEIGFNEEAIDVVANFLDQLPQTFLGDAKITFHESATATPDELGMYVIGAVTCDPNYKPAADYGYLIINPDVQEVELGWNIEDDNMIITNTLIKQGVYNMGAHVKVTDTVDKTTAEYVEANYLTDLIIGVDIHGNLIKTNSAEFASNPDSVKIGAYTQVALIADDANVNADADAGQMYYAVPIARAFAVVAELVDVKWENDNADRRFTYTGEPQSMKAEAYGMNDKAETVKLPDENLTIRYMGFDAKGIAVYDSEVPPTNVGAYVVLATYADESAEVYGVNVGAMTIEPATSTTVVEDYNNKFDPDFRFDQIIKTSGGESVVAGEDPEYISVVAGIKGEGTLIVDGVEFVDGVINIDLPDWLQKHVQKYIPEGYETGITIPELKEVFDYIETEVLPELIGDKLDGALAEYGIAIEYEKAIALLMDMVEEMAQGDVEIKITFAELEEVAPVNVGAYLVGAVALDSNFWPSYDTGVAIVTPDQVNAEIAYDDNFTSIKIDALEALSDEEWAAKLKATGKVIETGEAIDDKLIKYVYYGTTLAGETYMSMTPPREVGSYTEIAILADVTGEALYFSDPIIRPFTIDRLSPQITVDIIDIDEETKGKVYDGEGMDYAVIAKEDTADTDIVVSHAVPEDLFEDGDITVTFERIEDGLVVETYNGIDEFPTDAGRYAVVISYAGNDRYAPIPADDPIRVVFEITKKPVTVEISKISQTCADKDMAAKIEADPSGYFKASGLVGNDTVKMALEVAADYDYEVTGTYDITGTVEGTYNNYDITVVKGSITVAGHEYGKYIVTTPPTCTEAGVETKTCAVCGDEQTRPVKATGHSLKHIAAVDSTCTKEGNIEHWICEVCDAVFEDPEEDPVKASDVILPMVDHVRVNIPAVAPTCTDEGSTAGYKCQNCFDEYGFTKYGKAPEAVPALGHEYGDWIVDKEATCTEEGAKHKVCGVCDDVVSETIPVIPHTLVTDPAVAPTCTETGLTEGSHCGVCGHIEKAQTVVDALGHDLKAHERVDSTCTATGHEAYWECKTCKVLFADADGKDALDTFKVIPLKEHEVVIDRAEAATCTESGLSEGSHCGVCGTIIEEQKVEPATGHDLDFVRGKDATCTEAGFEYYWKCANGCGALFNDDEANDENMIDKPVVIPELGHQEDIDEAVEVTCLADGLTEGKHCDRCGVVLVEQKIVKARGYHDFAPIEDSAEATCEGMGYIGALKCNDCDAKIDKVIIPAKGHTLAAVEGLAPTCDEAGYEAYWLCGCGDMFADAEAEVKIAAPVVIPATGHSFTKYEVTEAPTCLEAGTETSICDVDGCGAKITKPIPAAGHVWADKYEIDKNATCTSAGYESIKCTVCDAIKDQNIIPASHDFGEYVYNEDATCTENGTETAKCQVRGCDGEITREAKDTATGHSYDGYTVDVEPTCTEAGSESKHCVVCDAIDESSVKAIDKLGHDEIIDPAVDATCTESGLTEGKHCGRCDVVLVEQDVVARLPHEYSDWSVAIEPSCTVSGQESRACECGDTQYRPLAALGHEYKLVVVKEATCTETGQHQMVCQVCDAVKDITVIAKKDHEYGEWTETKAATCTKAGKEERICAVCGDAQSRDLAKIDHTPEIIDPVLPTCTETGLTAGSKCSECNVILKAQETVAKLGHIEVIVPGEEATCTSEGLTEGKVCGRCEEVLVAQEVTKKAPHNYSDWIVDKHADCTEAGEKHIECELCGEIKFTSPISALGHDIVIDKAVAADCENTGLTTGFHCGVCGEVLKAQETVDKLDHKYGAWTVVTPADCEAAGQEARTCALCGDEETRPIGALGHNEVIDPAVEATETSEGKTEGKHCGRCGEIFVKQEIVPVLKHEHKEVVVSGKEATCTETGLTEGKVCGTCGEILVEQIVIDRLPHAYGEEIQHVPTVDDMGGKYVKCADCGHIKWNIRQTWEEYIKEGVEATTVELTATSTKYKTIAVKWVKSEGFSVNNYKVYRSTSGKVGTFNYIGTARFSNYTDRNAKVGTTYYYKVVGCRTVGDEVYKTQWSSVDTARVVTADYVKASSMSASTTYAAKGIKVKWTAPRVDMDGYQIYRATKLNGKYKLVKTTKGTARYWTNTGLKVGNRYYYKVRGFKYINGKKVYTKFSPKSNKYVLNATNGKLAATIHGVDGITADSAVKASNGIKVTWTKDDAVKCTKYKVYRATSKNGTYKLIAKTSNKYYTDKSSSLKKGKRYYYKIVGYRAFGKAEAQTNRSNAVSAVR